MTIRRRIAAATAAIAVADAADMFIWMLVANLPDREDLHERARALKREAVALLRKGNPPTK